MHLNEIKESIHNFLYVQDNPFKNVLPGGLWYVSNPKKPKDVVYSYGIFHFMPGDYDSDSMDEYENPVVRISLFDDADTPDNISDAGEKLDARFNNSQNLITIPSYYVLSIDRISPPNEFQTHLKRWQHIRDYKIQLQLK